jgi:kexin
MVFWGSAIDASKAHKYEAVVVEDLLPPLDELLQDPVIHPSATTSMKQHPKPTANLPDDHGVATGEKTKPAFSSANPTATSTSNHDDIADTAGTGWFSDMSNLLKSQKWLFIALGVVLLFGIAVGIFFWRRHVAKRSTRYTELNVDREMSVNPSGNSTPSDGLRTTKELYDPFGHLSDEEDDEDDDDDNEMTALTSARGGFVFHTDSLNVEAEEGPSSDALEPEPIYHDDPVSEDDEGQGESQEEKEPPKVDALASAASAIVALSEHIPSDD